MSNFYFRYPSIQAFCSNHDTTIAAQGPRARLTRGPDLQPRVLSQYSDKICPQVCCIQARHDACQVCLLSKKLAHLKEPSLALCQVRSQEAGLSCFSPAYSPPTLPLPPASGVWFHSYPMLKAPFCMSSAKKCFHALGTPTRQELHPLAPPSSLPPQKKSLATPLFFVNTSQQCF